MTCDSGHVLGLRNWTSTSAGSPIKSIWHRFPDGRWEFVEEGAVCPVTCSVWFGSGRPSRHDAGVRISWTGPRSLPVTTDDGYLAWGLTVRPTPVTRLVSGVPSRIPLALWPHRGSCG